MFSFGGSKDKGDLVGSMQYDPKVQRKSIDDPIRHHRRSSIPFVDRRPAVRFIRSIDARKASIAGPYDPNAEYNPQKPILKKTSFPILVNVSELGLQREQSTSTLSTNDDLETCRVKTEVIMEKISKSERVARGSMDILTFPTATRRVESLSRYQGCMTVSISTIGVYSECEALKTDKGKKKKTAPDVPEIRSVVDMAYEMQLEAGSLQTTAKKFLTLAKLRHNEWDELLKRNSEFRVEHPKLSYPIYTHKKMPESVTLYEDTLEEDDRYNLEGCVRVCRSYPEGVVSFHCEAVNIEKCDSVNFLESPMEQQMEIIKIITSHGKDLLFYSNSCLNQGLEVLQDHEIDDAFSLVQRKINSLEYDDYFDPLCALELKNALGEVVARKAELLNTAEQIWEHCKWIVKFTKAFHRYTKHNLGGGTNLLARCCCMGPPSKKKLLNLLGIVAVEEVLLLLPLSYTIAEKVFNLPESAFTQQELARRENTRMSKSIPKTLQLKQKQKS